MAIEYHALDNTEVLLLQRSNNDKIIDALTYDRNTDSIFYHGPTQGSSYQGPTEGQMVEFSCEALRGIPCKKHQISKSVYGGIIRERSLNDEITEESLVWILETLAPITPGNDDPNDSDPKDIIA
jgi:hypothetical protein